MYYCGCGSVMREDYLDRAIRVKGQEGECYIVIMIYCTNVRCANMVYRVTKIAPPEECKDIEIDWNRETTKVKTIEKV